MKKSLLILSMMALAVTSTAYADTVEAGTAEKPNYYTIQASRGNYRYLAYSPDGIILTTTIPATEEGGEDTKVSCTTHLIRNAEVDRYAVWEITPGTVDGTYIIKNSQADVYLMEFLSTAGEPSERTGGFANIVTTPTDIYMKDNGDGTYMPSLYNANGYTYFDEDWNYHGLDASSGDDTRYCGNYWAGDGVQWTFTKFDAEAVIAEEKEKYLPTLNSYIANVPAVATELQTGVDAIESITSYGGIAQIASAYNSAISAANTTLGTMYNGEVCTLKNLRRAADGLNSYIAVNMSGNNYLPVASTVDFNTQFTFKSVGNGGYKLYNDNTKTYINASFAPVSEEASALTVYPVLNFNGNYYGIAFPFSANKTGNGFNENEVADPTGGSLTSWSINDGGSIWSVAVVDVQAVLNEAINSVKTALEPYIPNMPSEIADILQAAVNEAEALEYNANLLTNAEALRTNAISDGNALLGTVFSEKVCTLKNLRRAAGGKNSYIAVNMSGDNYMPVASMADFNAQFTFKSVDNGGYTLYNDNTKTYINASFAPVSEETSALTVYPVLNSNGGFYGIAFPFNANKTGNGFNENNNADPTGGPLTSWSIDDGGSIWSVSVVDVQAALVDAINSVKTALEPYIPNVPEDIAEILQTAVNEAEALEYNANLVANAEALRTNAIADANNYLENNLGGKNWSIRSLRNGYVDVAAGDDLVETISSQESVNSVYEFVKVEDGGYKIYSQVAKLFFGPYLKKTEDAKETYVSLVSNYADAIKVYPVLNHYGSYYGISFALTDEGDRGFNTNAYGLHEYSINDGGSIFTITDKGAVTTAIVEVEKAESVSEGIYDLSGRKLSAPVRGINIINGKKVLVK